MYKKLGSSHSIIKEFKVTKQSHRDDEGYQICHKINWNKLQI